MLATYGFSGTLGLDAVRPVVVTSTEALPVTNDSTSSAFEPAVFRPPIPKMAGLLAGSLAFVALGLWMSSSPGRWPISMACVAFFGSCAAVAAWRLIRRPVMLTVYPDAVEDHHPRRIQFEDVDHIVLTRVSHSRFLVIMTREGTPSALAVKTAGITQGMNEVFLPGGSRAMWIPSAAVGIPLDQLAERLGTMIPCEIIRLA